MASSPKEPTPPPVVLFGYDASTFTLKIRLALKLKQIPYSFVAVPSMMPRPLLKDSFNLTYRKIPVLSIGSDVYADSSIITEALETFFPTAEGYGGLYPPLLGNDGEGAEGDGEVYRSLVRGMASYWTDRPLFRITVGLMPGAIWRTQFGVDRAGLIGHPLDADKLEAKIPENLTKLDTQLSLLEPRFATRRGKQTWIFDTASPGLADISLYYQLKWGMDVASGAITEGLTASSSPNTSSEAEAKNPMARVFNASRYPALFTWYRRFESYMANLPSTETPCTDFQALQQQMRDSPKLGKKSLLLPTPRPHLAELDAECGLIEGAEVSVTPDDTGRGDPTIGTLLALSPEEVVIAPMRLEEPAKVEVRVHFPRLGFVVRPYKAPPPLPARKGIVGAEAEAQRSEAQDAIQHGEEVRGKEVAKL